MRLDCRRYLFKGVVVMGFCLMAGAYSYAETLPPTYERALGLYYQNKTDESLKILQSMNPSKYPRRNLLLALDLVKKEQWAGADVALRNVKSEGEELKPYIQFLRVKVAVKMGRLSDAMSYLRQWEGSDKSPVLYGKAKIELAKGFVLAHRYEDLKETLKWFAPFESNAVIYGDVYKVQILAALEQQDNTKVLSLYGKMIQHCTM